MPDERPGPFIPSDRRPPMDVGLDQAPLLRPGAAKKQIRRYAGAALGDTVRAWLHINRKPLPAKQWRTHFTHAPYVTWTLLDGEAVVINLQTGHYYTLNRVGAVIWGLLMDGRTLDEIAAAMGERYDVSAEQVRADLAVFTTGLREEKLIRPQRSA